MTPFQARHRDGMEMPGDVNIIASRNGTVVL